MHKGIYGFQATAKCLCINIAVIRYFSGKMAKQTSSSYLEFLDPTSSVLGVIVLWGNRFNQGTYNSQKGLIEYFYTKIR